MRVICIKQGKWLGRISRKEYVGPAYMEECTVQNQVRDVYEIKGYEQSGGAGYAIRWFIPLSSIDETEMERNYKTEKV